MSEGWAHIQLKDEDYRKLREQLCGQGVRASFHINGTEIPLYLDNSLLPDRIKMVSRNPYSSSWFVLWVENIGSP